MDENLQENKELNTENIPEDIVIGLAEEIKETAGKKPKVKREKKAKPPKAPKEPKPKKHISMILLRMFRLQCLIWMPE